MVTYYLKFKKVFSIPGRIRIKVNGLLKNNYMAQNIKISLKKIKDIIEYKVSVNSGNILIIYNEDKTEEKDIISKISCLSLENSSILSSKSDKKEKSAFKIMIKSLNPLNYIKFGKNRLIYKEEINISKKVTLIGLLVGGLMVLFNYPINSVLSVLTLSYTVSLFAISNIGCYLASKSIEENLENIYVNNYNVIKILNSSEYIGIEDDIFLTKFNLGKVKFQKKEFDENVIQKLVILNDIENPISKDMRNFIFGARENGIKEIKILKKENQDNGNVFKYISACLKLKEIGFLDINNAYMEKTPMIVVFEKTAEKFDNIGNKILIGVYLYQRNKADKVDINIKYNNLSNMSYILRKSMYATELIKRCQALSIVLDFAAMFLIVSKYYRSVLVSIFLYLTNIFASSLYLKNNLYLNIKESIYADKYFKGK